MNIVLCDDNSADVNHYSSMIRRCAERHHQTIDFHTYESADALLQNAEAQLGSVDLIYLDIHMAGTDGMRAASKLREMGYEGDIVFLTVDRDKVFQAFEVQAMHYLVKADVDGEKFDRLFMWAVERAQKRRQEYICLTCAGETLNVALDEIVYFTLENRIIVLNYCVNGENKRFEFYSTLGKLENTLNGHGFARINHSQLLSIRQIKSLQADSILLKNGETLSLSRRQASVLNRLCEEYHIDV